VADLWLLPERGRPLYWPGAWRPDSSVRQAYWGQKKRGSRQGSRAWSCRS